MSTPGPMDGTLPNLTFAGGQYWSSCMHPRLCMIKADQLVLNHPVARCKLEAVLSNGTIIPTENIFTPASTMGAHAATQNVVANAEFQVDHTTWFRFNWRLGNRVLYTDEEVRAARDAKDSLVTKMFTLRFCIEATIYDANSRPSIHKLYHDEEVQIGFRVWSTRRAEN